MTEFLQSNVNLWIVIGIFLMLTELFVPGVLLVFFGFGAWTVALILFFSIKINFNLQLLFFLITSIAYLLLLRRFFAKSFMGKFKVQDADPDNEFIGKIATAEKDIIKGKEGKISFKGTSWRATSDEDIKKGENVLITEINGIVIKVKKGA